MQMWERGRYAMKMHSRAASIFPSCMRAQVCPGKKRESAVALLHCRVRTAKKYGKWHLSKREARVGTDGAAEYSVVTATET